jgi:hypothetical protein
MMTSGKTLETGKHGKPNPPHGKNYPPAKEKLIPR